jgi:phosphomannomutase
MNKIAEYYAGGETDWLDGLTIKFPDFWFNVRSSSNEPLLRLNLEAETEELLTRKEKELTELITTV